MIQLPRDMAQTLYDFVSELNYYEMMMILSKTHKNDTQLEIKYHETIKAISRLSLRLEEDKRKEGK